VVLVGISPARIASTLGMVAASAGAAYAGLVTGALAVDLGVGRRTRPLGPLSVDIGATREEVFDLLARPYLGPRPTRAAQEKITVLERGSDMVLALHRTPVRPGVVARTVETVRFTRPERVDFRLVRGPVPYVVEEFVLTHQGLTTRLEYNGEMATDLWVVGKFWGDLIARRWQTVVAESFVAVKAEAERKSTGPGPR
jgi:hypothetical protein